MCRERAYPVPPALVPPATEGGELAAVTAVAGVPRALVGARVVVVHRALGGRRAAGSARRLVHGSDHAQAGA